MTQHPRPNSLDDVLDTIWSHLEIGAAKARHGFHQPVLATTAPDGTPHARTVVLRVASRAEGFVACHTDARSPKLLHLRTNPIAAWVFYTPARRIQVRATGIATIHTDDAIADEHWRKSPTRSRRCYAAPRTPGTESDHPSPNLPDALTAREPTPEESEAGRGNFAVLRCAIQHIDYLELHHDGHVRAEFSRVGDAWQGVWTEP